MPDTAIKKRANGWRQYYARHDLKRLRISIDPQVDSDLRNYAKRNNITITEAIRRFIEWGIEHDK